MSEYDRQTWQQNDYDPRFIETEEGLRIARAFEEGGAERIVAEHNAFGELLEAAKYVRAQANEAIGGEPYVVSPGGFYCLQAAIEKAKPQTPKERR